MRTHVSAKMQPAATPRRADTAFTTLLAPEMKRGDIYIARHILRILKSKPCLSARSNSHSNRTRSKKRTISNRLVAAASSVPTEDSARAAARQVVSVALRSRPAAM